MRWNAKIDTFLVGYIFVVIALGFISAAIIGHFLPPVLPPDPAPKVEVEVPQPQPQVQHGFDEATLEAIDSLIKSLEQLEQELQKYNDLSERTSLPEGVLACITAQARANGFDPSETLGRIQLESGFDADCISLNKDENGKVVSADIGLMQINSKTAPWLWSKVMGTPYEAAYEVVEGIFIDERLFDPVANIKMGSWFYGKLLKQYNGDKEKANTAYNRGPGGLNVWIASRGTARSPYSDRVMGLADKWTSIDEI